VIDFLRPILQSQFEAALCMLKDCAHACTEEQWDGKVANGSFRWAIYHTLFFCDYYLSTEEGFRLRPIHERGGDERGDEPAPGLNKADTLEYVAICRSAIVQSLAGETEESMRGPSGFSWRKCTRAELHIYNIRHIQHHVGGMAAYLRRVNPELGPKSKELRWVGHGWR